MRERKSFHFSRSFLFFSSLSLSTPHLGAHLQSYGGQSVLRTKFYEKLRTHPGARISLREHKEDTNEIRNVLHLYLINVPLGPYCSLLTLYILSPCHKGCHAGIGGEAAPSFPIINLSWFNFSSVAQLLTLS